MWVAVLGFEKAVYPYAFPTVFSVAAAFLFSWLFSITDRSARASQDREAFEAQLVRSELGTY